MRYKICFLFLFSAIHYFALSQPKNQSNQNDLIWEDKVYKKGINTILIYKSGWELSMPVIELNTTDKIQVSFDEIKMPKTRYEYLIVHCTPDWKESKLEQFEYIEGPSVGVIEQAEFAQNTLVKYINYQLSIPNDDCKILISGNYLLKVFEENKPEKLVFTRRFYVFEKNTEITAKVEKIKTFRNDGLNQRYSFAIDYDESAIENPTETLSYRIIKNNEREKYFEKLKPSAIYGNRLEFYNSEVMLFAGGNEFRHFDLKNFKFLSDRLQEIEKKTEYNSVILKVDETRDMTRYAAEKDLNGKRLIKLEGQERSNILADYCMVHFELDMPLNIVAGDYLIWGSLTDYCLSDDYKLNYNHTSKKFEKTLFLKQGYYNYLYRFESPDKLYNTDSDKYKVEGNHFETENEYHLFIYSKSFRDNYHRLVGYLMKNSQ